MYAPRYAQNSNTQEILAFIREYGFATLVNQVEGKLWATHTPLLLNEEGTRITGHISKANKQWKGFSEKEEVLAIFQGPHTYVSPSWYDHENVPTWNYIAVHVYGTLRTLEGDALIKSLKGLVDKYEAHSEAPVTVEGMSSGYVEKEMKGLVAFEITITRMEASYKLSQNRDPKNHERIIRELKKRGDAQSMSVAEAMERNPNKPVSD
jgi:transcriptional regulator